MAGKKTSAAKASMMAVNEMTADAMLGTPDSDLWHNVDDLLHNVNDLMSRLDPEPSKTEAGHSRHNEGDGEFFTHDAQVNTALDESASTAAVHQEYFETQVGQQYCTVCLLFAGTCSINMVCADCMSATVHCHVLLCADCSYADHCWFVQHCTYPGIMYGAARSTSMFADAQPARWGGLA